MSLIPFLKPSNKRHRRADMTDPRLMDVIRRRVSRRSPLFKMTTCQKSSEPTSRPRYCLFTNGRLIPLELSSCDFFSLRRHLLHSINHVFLGLLPFVSYVSLSLPFVSVRVFFLFLFFISKFAVSPWLSEETSLQHPRTENVNTHIVILAHLEDLREGQRSGDTQLGRGKDDTQRRR